MKQLSRKDVLEQTAGGLKLFQILLPELQMSNGRNVENIDSPISNGKKCLSIFKWKQGVYFFKDHYTKVYGDIFEFIGRLNNIESKTGFKHVLEIITKLLEEHNANILSRDEEIETYRDEDNGTELMLAKEPASAVFISKNFQVHFPYFDSLPKYDMKLVLKCTYLNKEKAIRQIEFDYSKPKEAFYALTIIEGQYYILFNPYNRQCYAWGVPEEYYVIGQENLFEIAYSKNLYLRHAIVLTNNIMGLLFLQDKGIPSIAFLNGETIIPEYFEYEILPLFPNRYYLGDMVGTNSMDQINIFFNRYDFKIIRTRESYLTSFFENNANPEDIIMSEFNILEESDCYKYEGRKPNIVSVNIPLEKR